MKSKYSKEKIKEIYNFFINKCLELSGYERDFFLTSRLREVTKWRFSVWTILRIEYRCSYTCIAKLENKNNSSIRWGVTNIKNALEHPACNPSYNQTYRILLDVGREFLNLTKESNINKEFIHTTYEDIERWLDENQVGEIIKFRLLTSLDSIKY